MVVTFEALLTIKIHIVKSVKKLTFFRNCPSCMKMFPIQTIKYVLFIGFLVTAHQEGLAGAYNMWNPVTIHIKSYFTNKIINEKISAQDL